MSTRQKSEYCFAPIEEYMLLDDSPAYPMDSLRLLHFTGIFSEPEVRKAVEEVVFRHPLLRSLAVKEKGRFFWRETDREVSVVFRDADKEQGALNASGFPVMRRLDLFTEPGFRLYVIQSRNENWTKFLFQFHHSVSDGLGEMRILGEFMTRYAINSGIIPAGTEYVRSDLSKLSLRMKIGWKLGRYLRNAWHTNLTTMQLAFGNPVPFLAHTPAERDSECADYPYLQSLQLNRGETQAYVEKAKRLGVTVNDLLLRDFYVTIDQWRVRSGKDLRGTTRVMVPMSLRGPEHEDIPASNVVSSIFLDRTKRQISGDSRKLLESIHREMVWGKKHDQKYVFMLTISILQKIGLFPFFLHSRKCRASGVLSNLGRVLDNVPVSRNESGKIQLGGNVLEFVEAAPPIRFKTLIAFSALTYAARLRLCLRYDHRVISPEEAADFLKIFRENLMK